MIQTYTCVFDKVDEFLFSDADTISIGPVWLVARRPIDKGHDMRDADAMISVVASGQDEATKRATNDLDMAVAVLDYAIFKGSTADRSPSSQGRCHLEPRGDLLDGYPRFRRKRGPPDRCVELHRDGPQHRTSFNGSRISSSTVAVDICSHHVPDLINMVFPMNSASHVSKRQKKLHSAIFAAVDQLHKSIRHDMYSEGRELALLRSITGLEALFTESGVDNTSAIASAVGYGAAFASVVCQTEAERLVRWNRVRELYSTWSNIVHGLETDEPAEQDVLDARAILVDSIEACVLWSDDITTDGLQEWVTRQRFGCGSVLPMPARG